MEINKQQKEKLNDNKKDEKLKIKHKFLENMFNQLDSFNNICDDVLIQYIKPFFYERAYTIWWIYLFILSIYFTSLRSVSFIIGSVMCFGWNLCVVFDYYLYNKPYDVMYRALPTYSKRVLHCLDLLSHTGLFIVSYFTLVNKLTLMDVLYAWIYSKIWSYVQSDGKSFYYKPDKCRIYNCRHPIIFVCSHSIEIVILLINVIFILMNK